MTRSKKFKGETKVEVRGIELPIGTTLTCGNGVEPHACRYWYPFEQLPHFINYKIDFREQQ